MYRFPKRSRRSAVRDCLITLGLLLLGCAISSLLLLVEPNSGVISMIFVLIVVLTARLTEGYRCGVAASFVGVICVNYVFTYPYWEFNFTISGYPLTFLTMLTVSLIVSTLTSQIKLQEQLRVETDRETMRANLLRAVSHDLRTPLTSIVGSASAILENDERLDSAQRTVLLRDIRDEGQWMIRMVENLLSVTAITSHCPDVILLDLGLPDMDGSDILKFVREWSACPIIVVSARNHERDKVDALDAGADDYIVKPFGTSELLARIRAAIRHTRTHLPNGEIAQSGQFRVMGLVIDYDKHQVLVDGENAHLTQNEYKIVSLLGKYAGKVLTYDFIMRQLWGPNAQADNQILRVNMANIRRKIEKNPAQPQYIFTEIGVGYRMADPS